MLRGPPADLVLGQDPSTGAAMVSSWKDEQKIAALTEAVDLVLDRCEETFHNTSHNILRWLRSTRHDQCYRKPFSLVGRPTSKKKYRRLFQRFFALVFRAFRLGSDLHQLFTHTQFSTQQSTQMEAIWDHAAWDQAHLTKRLFSRSASTNDLNLAKDAAGVFPAAYRDDEESERDASGSKDEDESN